MQPKGDEIRRFQIELARHIYEPNKTELEEEFDLDVPGDTAVAKVRRMTHARVRPVNARLKSKPENRW
ncbi:MAG: hypothetical protein OXT71_08965 [Acidobacteriota bacterium]|nr:hypothetical protein [Acidobacteriota bacterium]